MKRICVFCGSNPGADPAFKRMAEKTGHLLADNNVGLVYGGGSVGLMGVVADAVLERGGEVIGVIPDSLFRKEVAHAGLSKLHVVPTMHERKQLMYDLSDAFIALPGGYGTFDELFEVVTWSQLGLHQKPCGVINVSGYFNPLIQMIDQAVAFQFIRTEQRKLLLEASEPEELWKKFESYSAPRLKKWIDPESR